MAKALLRDMSQSNGETAEKNGVPHLGFIKKYEKLTATVVCTTYPSLAEWIKRRGGDSFLRSLIEEAKRHAEKLEMLEELIEKYG